MSEKKSLQTHSSTELGRTIGRVLDLIDREDPDPEALDALRKVLRENDVFREVHGNLAKLARHEVIRELTKSRFVWESVRAWVNHIRGELGYESAPMLEKLLIEEIVIRWLRLYERELTYSRIRSQGSVTLEQGAYWDRHLSAAQRRLLRACTTLSRIRKMAGRTPELMQLNIGAQQVNVAQVSED